jgi:iron complex outermembrane receptor protein
MTSKFQKKSALVSAVILAGTAGTSLTMAQSESGPLVLEEVVVTAQKKEETLTEAPVAVNLVSGQDINDLSMFQADELNKLVTGMEVRYEGDSNTGVGLRGVGTFQQQSAPARVGTYMDDFYMASQAAVALSSMFDLANVQVLKGPQGTLYGQPSPTGALILTTQDPNFEGFSGYVQGSYMDPEGYNLQGAVNIPIVDNSLAMRVAVLSDERETGVENVVRKLDEERNRDGIRVKLLWEPTPNFYAKLGYTYMESKNSEAYRALETVDPGQANFDLEADDRIAIADARSELLEKEDTLGTLHLNWSVGEVDIKWFSGYLESIQSSLDDADTTDQPLVTLDVETDFGKDFDAHQHELRVSGNAFNFWDWTVGAYYSETFAQTNVLANQHIVGTGVFPFKLDIPIDTEIRALFTHNSIALGADTDLTIGVRYNEFKQDAKNIQSGDFLFGSEMLPGGEITDPTFVLENAFPCIDGSQAPCVLSAKYDEEEWTGTIKLSHFFSESLNVYGTLDRGYRPGAANFDTTGVFTPDFNAYGGEKVDSVEIGAKGSLFDGGARYTAAVFYSVYEDYQVPVNFEAFNLITEEVEVITNAPFTNVDEAVQQGVEADIRMLVNPNWMIYAGVTYAQVEFTDGTLPCTDPTQPPVGPDNRYNTCDADGEIASAQPEWSGVLQTEYTFPGLVAGSDGYVGALWSYRGDGEVPGDTTGRLETDSFSTLDLFVGLRSEGWTAQLFAKNVTDDDGVLSKRPVENSYNEMTVVAPRTIGITASYNF